MHSDLTCFWFFDIQEQLSWLRKYKNKLAWVVFFKMMIKVQNGSLVLMVNSFDAKNNRKILSAIWGLQLFAFTNFAQTMSDLLKWKQNV